MPLHTNPKPDACECRDVRSFNPFERSVTSMAEARRKMLEDDNIVISAERLAKICGRIAQQSDARDFLGTSDGIAFLNCVYSMTGCDAIYDLKVDCEREFGADLERESVLS